MAAALLAAVAAGAFGTPKRANMTIQYDAAALSGWVGFFKLFLRYRGTILAGAITGPLFWLVNLLHVAMLVIRQDTELRIGVWQDFDFGNGTKAQLFTPSFEPVVLPPVRAARSSAIFFLAAARECKTHVRDTRTRARLFFSSPDGP